MARVADVIRNSTLGPSIIRSALSLNICLPQPGQARHPIPPLKLLAVNCVSGGVPKPRCAWGRQRDPRPVNCETDRIQNSKRLASDQDLQK